MKSWNAVAFLAVLGSVATVAVPNAQAMSINPIFDASITNSIYASVIENAFDKVALDFDASLSSQVTINVKVSWGSVGTYALPSNAVGASLDPLYGDARGNYLTYGAVKSLLSNLSASNPGNLALKTAVSNLRSSTPSGTPLYAVPAAEAKILGMLPANYSAIDGYIGFSGSPTNFSFNPAAGIAAGTYDFQAVAAHELDEVLGRISGVGTSGSATYRTPFDLFRYTAPGVLTTSSTALSYFSLDGGMTPIAYFNNSIYGGDRADWLTPGVTNSVKVGNTYTYPDTSHAVANDVQDAFISAGQRGMGLSAADLAALDALGYSGNNSGNSVTPSPTAFAYNLIDSTDVPEPGSVGILMSALAVFGFVRRRKTA